MTQLQDPPKDNGVDSSGHSNGDQGCIIEDSHDGCSKDETSTVETTMLGTK